MAREEKRQCLHLRKWSNTQNPMNKKERKKKQQQYNIQCKHWLVRNTRTYIKNKNKIIEFGMMVYVAFLNFVSQFDRINIRQTFGRKKERHKENETYVIDSGIVHALCQSIVPIIIHRKLDLRSTD